MLTLELTKDNACNDDDIIEMLNGLKEKIRADGQRSLNDQFYTLTGDTSSEPHNAPLQQRKLLRSSSVPPEEERKLSRSSSFDEGYNSDGENYGNNLPSSIGSDISIEKVAKSRNV